ncbi:MAG: hypothetical protein ACYS1A_08390 [Planctomycetota bacterium]|jgi:hypothetical protein
MNDAKDLASRRATQETLKQPPPPQQQEVSLTTFDELLAEYKTGIVKTSSGKTFEIQCVSPGDFLLSVGSPLIQAISESGADLTSESEVNKVIADLSEEETFDLVANEDFIELIKQVVIRGVISVNLVDKKQNECNKRKKEISIDLLPIPDILDVYTAIMNLSVSEEDTAEVQLFRQESEGEQSEHNTDTSDSPDLRGETIEPAVSEEA